MPDPPLPKPGISHRSASPPPAPATISPIHHPSSAARHAYNAIIALPLSRAQRAWLLRSLHTAAGHCAPPPDLAAAMVARGRIRALRDLRALPAFGRRRHRTLRRVFADPAFHTHLASLLHTLTDRAAALPGLPLPPGAFLAHPFGEGAWFPPTVARLLDQDGRLLYGRPRPLRGFGFCRHIVGYSEAVLRPVPPRAVVIGGGYVGVELALAWAQAGSAVTLVHTGASILFGYDAEAVAQILALLDAAGVTLLLSTTATGWRQRAGFIEVETTAATLPAELLLVAVGIIYPPVMTAAAGRAAAGEAG